MKKVKIIKQQKNIDGTVKDSNNDEDIEECLNTITYNDEEEKKEKKLEIKKCYEDCLEDAMKEEKEFIYDRSGHRIKIKDQTIPDNRHHRQKHVTY